MAKKNASKSTPCKVFGGCSFEGIGSVDEMQVSTLVLVDVCALGSWMSAESRVLTKV